MDAGFRVLSIKIKTLGLGEAQKVLNKEDGYMGGVQNPDAAHDYPTDVQGPCSYLHLPFSGYNLFWKWSDSNT